jgi:mannose-6-phosphate isomerase class I
VRYNPRPTYALPTGEVAAGWDAVDRLLVPGRRVAFDGPAALPWEEVAAALCRPVADVRELPAWRELGVALADAIPSHDPDFAPVPRGTLGDYFHPEAPRRLAWLVGPGSSLAGVDDIVLLGYPKRLQAGTAGNLGTPPGIAGTAQRLFYVDWPLVDRHQQSLVAGARAFVDVSDPARPTVVAGDDLRAAFSHLAERPFRTLPTFLPGPWGGRWLRETIGIETDAPNLAWSYELIAPEAAIVLGGEEVVEVPFDLFLAVEHERILGRDVARVFGSSFPIRFDYLDTLGGGHLSLQCHPTPEYAAEIFGLEYTQQESYYVVDTMPAAPLFLGLRDPIDVAAFRRAAVLAADEGIPLAADAYVQTLPARRHQLYLIPPGTIHASGAQNVVLEVSATPYLYTLRFYDWLRRNLDGELRPVHLHHAFANLDARRRGAAVAELVPEPRVVRSGEGWQELELGRRPDLLFAVHRLELTDEVTDDTKGRFHVLNLVEGAQARIEPLAGGAHELAFGETIVVPAATGGYRVRTYGGACRLVKAFVA